VRIEGHTDDVGKDELNKRLSLQRAGSVMEYLVSRGIAPKRIVTAGYGKNRPIVPNVTPENRAKNRRVELTLIGK
jgi:outer membrane protein OmpA-like peptidoglycan-associated protein